MQQYWQPACTRALLQARARLLADIRAFFAEREVLEVETPLLCQATGTDPQLDFFSTPYHCPPDYPQLYLQTSPEFAMKRLLAAGSGSIYQICKAFRNGEAGRFHNPEFTILEWYRIGFSLQALMDEVATLLLRVLANSGMVWEVRQRRYQAVFFEQTGLDPLHFDLAAYQSFAAAHALPEAYALCGNDHPLWLDLLFSHWVQPRLAQGVIWLIHDYPAIQSSLARISEHDARVVERFEVFINGVELGNGFLELTDPCEQERRFDAEIAYRQAHGLAPVTKDMRFLAALRHGLPDCSGVAVGLDRLLILATASEHIDKVLAFPLSRA